jgi:hypothetical protein
MDQRIASLETQPKTFTIKEVKGMMSDVADTSMGQVAEGLTSLVSR